MHGWLLLHLDRVIWKHLPDLVLQALSAGVLPLQPFQHGDVRLLLPSVLWLVALILAAVFRLVVL